MRSLFERLRWLKPHDAKLTIESQSSASLSLRNDRTLIVFDRLSRAVTQNGRQVATFGSIHSVLVDAETHEDRPIAWLVTIQLAGSRAIVVGRTTDNSEASIVASHIAMITGTRVVAKHAI